MTYTVAFGWALARSLAACLTPFDPLIISAEAGGVPTSLSSLHTIAEGISRLDKLGSDPHFGGRMPCI